MASRVSSRSPRSASLPPTARDAVKKLGFDGVNPVDAEVGHVNYLMRHNRKATQKFGEKINDNIKNLVKLCLKLGSAGPGELVWENGTESHVIDRAYVKGVTNDIIGMVRRLVTICYASRPTYSIAGTRIVKEGESKGNPRVINSVVTDYLQALQKEYSKKYGTPAINIPSTEDKFMIESRDLQNIISLYAEQNPVDGKQFRLSQNLYNLLAQPSLAIQEVVPPTPEQIAAQAQSRKIMGGMGIDVEPKPLKSTYRRVLPEEGEDGDTGLAIISERTGTTVRVGDYLPTSVASVIVSFYTYNPNEDGEAKSSIDLKPWVNAARNSATYQAVLLNRKTTKEAEAAKRRATVAAAKPKAKKASTVRKSMSPQAKSKSKSPRPRNAGTPAGLFDSSSSSSSCETTTVASPPRRRR